MSQNDAGHLMKLAREQQFDALEEAWMEALEDSTPPYEELFRVARYLVKKQCDDLAGLLLWSLVAAETERKGPFEALSTAKTAASIAPSQEQLRNELLDLYRQTSSDEIPLEAIFELTGLTRDGENISDAIAQTDSLVHLQPGAYVLHRLSLRAGRVLRHEAGEVYIESAETVFHHGLSEVLQLWQPISSDDFRALVVFEKERLNTMARDDPEQLIRLMLKSHRSELSFKQFKFALIPHVITQEEWTSWWQSVRRLLTRSQWIDVTSGTQPTFRLRQTAASYGEQLLDRISAVRDPAAKCSVIMKSLSTLNPDNKDDIHLINELQSHLRGASEHAGAPQQVMLHAAGFAVHRLASPDTPYDFGALNAALRQIAEQADELLHASDEETGRAILDAIRHARPQDWPSIYAAAFPGASLKQCDQIAAALRDNEHIDLLAEIARRIAANPDTAPLPLAWLWRYRLGEEAEAETHTDTGHVTLTVALLNVMNRLESLPSHAENRTEARQLLSKLRTIVSANDFHILRELIRRVDASPAKDLHAVLSSGTGLREHDAQELIELIRTRHPQEFEEEVPLWKEPCVYTTAEGLAKQRSRLERIVNEDMRANAVAIGTAAEKGDLRENWEYKAALEERDRLVERATRLREQIEKARVLRHEDIPDEIVSVGASVSLRSEAPSHECKIVFLGPWDADIENGIYSYMAPLSHQFMGRKVGDRVHALIQDIEADFEIVSIERAI